jgi:hypothetical protein
MAAAFFWVSSRIDMSCTQAGGGSAGAVPEPGESGVPPSCARAEWPQ